MRASEMDVTTQTLQAAAELLTLRRDSIHVIDAPVVKVPQTVQKEETKDEDTVNHPQGRKGSPVGPPEVSSNLYPEVSG